jgi:hypothetical protein
MPLDSLLEAIDHSISETKAMGDASVSDLNGYIGDALMAADSLSEAYSNADTAALARIQGALDSDSEGWDLEAVSKLMVELVDAGIGPEDVDTEAGIASQPSQPSQPDGDASVIKKFLRHLESEGFGFCDRELDGLLSFKELMDEADSVLLSGTYKPGGAVEPTNADDYMTTDCLPSPSLFSDDIVLETRYRGDVCYSNVVPGEHCEGEWVSGSLRLVDYGKWEWEWRIAKGRRLLPNLPIYNAYGTYKSVTINGETVAMYLSDHDNALSVGLNTGHDPGSWSEKLRTSWGWPHNEEVDYRVIKRDGALPAPEAGVILVGSWGGSEYTLRQDPSKPDWYVYETEDEDGFRKVGNSPCDSWWVIKIGDFDVPWDEIRGVSFE